MRSCLIVALGVLSFVRICGAGEFHEFRTLSGKSVKAEVLGYNGRLDEVTLKLPNRNIRKVHPGLFVAEDQKYIKNWALLFGFKSTSKFTVKVNKKSGDFKRVETKKGGTAKVQEIRYDIVLESFNSYPLEEVSVEYKIFARSKGSGLWHPALASELGLSISELKNPPPVSGAKAFREIVSGETYEVQTKYVQKIKAKGTLKADSSGKTYKNQELAIEGIWVRVLMEIDGETIYRDFFTPNTLKGKHAWTDESDLE